MQTTTLIETTSCLYLKRLVRELNAQPDGFYAPVAGFNVRCNRARLKGETLQCHSFGSPEWFTPGANSFSDAYGREIVASRR